MLRRHSWIIAGAVLLLTMASLQLLSMRQETQTYDEAAHLAAGYSYLKTGDFRMNPEHPALAKMLCALPLLALPLKPVDTWEQWKKGDEFEFGRSLLYRNNVGVDELLFRGRAVTVALTFLLGLLLLIWTRARFGALAALFALTFFCFDPNIIAHGRYVTTDLMAALTIFAACLAWERYLTTFRPLHLVIAAVAFGIALVSKYSTVILIPIFAVTFLIHAPAAKRWSQAALAAATLFIAALLAIGIAYWPETSVVLHHQRPVPPPNETTSAFLQGKRLMEVTDDRTETGRLLKWLGKRFHLRAHTWFVGLNSVASHNMDGQDTYLLGDYSQFGWWYYFPVAFAVKSPTALIATLAAMLVWGIARLRRARPDVRNLRPAVTMLVVAPLLYFGASMASNLNLGIRHLLPVYPFLFVAIGMWLAYAWQSRRMKIAVGAVVAALMIESIAVYPNYLAFFNTLSGGPAHGPEYLVDSNIDWGQDVKKLKRYMDAKGVSKICLAYFGNANIADYGIGEAPVPVTSDVAGRSRLDCIVAVSATVLHDLYIPRGSYAWIRKLTPVDRIGYSIYVYDFRKKRS